MLSSRAASVTPVVDGARSSTAMADGPDSSAPQAASTSANATSANGRTNLGCMGHSRGMSGG